MRGSAEEAPGKRSGTGGGSIQWVVVALAGTCSRANPCQRPTAASTPIAWTRPHIQIQDLEAPYRLHPPAPAPTQEPPTKGTGSG